MKIYQALINIWVKIYWGGNLFYQENSAACHLYFKCNAFHAFCDEKSYRYPRIGCHFTPMKNPRLGCFLELCGRG